MKKRFYKIVMIICLTSSLVSCSQSESKTNSEIVSYFNKNSKDPKSYEFVEIKIIDTITAKECADSIQRNNDKFIENMKNRIVEYETKIAKKKEEIEEAKSSYGVESDMFKDFLANWNESISRKNKNINDIKKIITDVEKQNLKLTEFSKSSEIISYVYLHKYRIKNELGKLDLFESYFTFDKDYTILNKSEDILEPYKITNKKFEELYLHDKKAN